MNDKVFTFPVRGRSYRVFFEFVDGRGPWTGPLTSLVCVLSPDGAHSRLSSNPPVQVAETGIGYVDLSPDEMMCSSIQVMPLTSQVRARCLAQTVVPLTMEPEL
jgi:hypothetical protein